MQPAPPRSDWLPQDRWWTHASGTIAALAGGVAFCWCAQHAGVRGQGLLFLAGLSGALVGFAAAKRWLQLPAGQLSWDGKAWFWRQPNHHAVGARGLSMVVDLGSWVLLRWRVEAEPAQLDAAQLEAAPRDADRRDPLDAAPSKGLHRKAWRGNLWPSARHQWAAVAEAAMPNDWHAWRATVHAHGATLAKSSGVPGPV